jgi:hypothetical protein
MDFAGNNNDQLLKQRGLSSAAATTAFNSKQV